MRVTKYMLETYRATLCEIEVLKIQLDKLREDERSWVQTDTVKGSSPEFPYMPTVFKVSGFSAADTESVSEIKKLQKQIKSKLIAKKLALQKNQAAIELWLDGVDDPNIRSIIRLYYIDGFSFSQICETLGMNGDGSTQRKQLERFWKNQK